MYVYTPITRKTIGSDARFDLQSLHEPSNLFIRIHRVGYISPECQPRRGLQHFVAGIGHKVRFRWTVSNAVRSFIIGLNTL